jgi:hypothetical protein
MAAFTKGDQVTVAAPGLVYSGRTGRVCCVRSDGDYEVEGLGLSFFDVLCGPPIYKADQLKPANRT